MSTPSILSAIQKLRLLLTREEKFKWLGIAGFALCTSLLEVLTATVIVIFAQVLTQPLMGQHYLSKLGIGNDLSSTRILFYFSIILGVMYLIKNSIATLELFYQSFSIQKMNYLFKQKLLQKYAKIDYGFYLTRNSSLGMHIVNGDTELMFSSAMTALASILSESIIFLCLIAMLVYMNPVLALVTFGLGSIIIVVVTKLMKQIYRWGKKLQEVSIASEQNLMQFFHAFKEIVLLGKTDAFINAYQVHSQKKSHLRSIQTTTNALPRMILEVLFVGLFMVTIAILCLEHESPVQMIGILGGYLYAGFRLMPGLTRIIGQLATFKSAIPSIEQVYHEYSRLGTHEVYIHAPDFVFEKSISLNNVSFNYLNTRKNALEQVSLEIKKGECIGIVGETGSGKSTLVDVILGLLRPGIGTVLVDNRFPVNSLQWHQRIGYVPQSIYLIDDTIEANIAFGESEIDVAKLQQVIDSAQLRKFIDKLQAGTKTVVGERGVRLSGGERQRIAIARALYRNPEVLIFDEATSALDNETEARLMETIHSLRQNRTVIMIAHRLTTLKNCERIVMMEHGSIKQIMVYDELTPAFGQILSNPAVAEYNSIGSLNPGNAL